MYKILYQMVFDLLKFLFIWAIVIVMFSCLTVLGFANIETFRTFPETVVYFIQAALGNYDLETFVIAPKDDTEEQVEIAEGLSQLGIYYMLVSLLINMVLMLNFVIAILGNTYSLYADDIGIYYITVLE